eukprot:scaffold73895_cov19-Tisochrysis_lutea.AAC.4
MPGTALSEGPNEFLHVSDDREKAREVHLARTYGSMDPFPHQLGRRRHMEPSIVKGPLACSRVNRKADHALISDQTGS